MPPRPLVIPTLLLALLLAAGGCATVRTTDPRRTATEQFLLSSSARRAVEQLVIGPLQDRAVYVDNRYFESVDEPFVLGELRAFLLEGGVRLMEDRDNAEIVLEPRTGGVGIDRYDFLLGIPGGVVPQTDTTTNASATDASFATPELAIIKNLKQKGISSISFVAYWRDDGTIVAASGPTVGRSSREDWWYFGYGPRSGGDIAPVEKDQ